ncbi:IS481 family transposase [Streptacidiphilus carbonis]|uniref:IS481 family transposase n=1 Tax=Streptacidiphilus carbonis TaxID=105422 RepID=UPI0005AA09EE|nr:IS481 family transposase [Streptacidiphilus carbonis]
MAEHRYRAVLQVLDGVAVAQVARQAGASRQSVYTWVERYHSGGLDALMDRSRRPHVSPHQVAAEVEALVCELRRSYPRWGARRIAHELGQRGLVPVPGRSTVHRILTRHGLVNNQDQNHRRVYRRWQRDAPMQLWQLDIMGGVFLADGRECKLVTGIDDHSRFIVIAKVIANQSGRAVCTAFAEAMTTYGVPCEVLTDNGKQFTGRYTKPAPAEVLFERICRENGVTARLTKPRSPTTTGKIERFHKTLRRELLDHVGQFADQGTAQAAIDAWVHAYNHARPHQSLAMATPAAVFRPTPADPPRPGHQVDLPSVDPPQKAAVEELLAPRLPALLPSPRLPVDETQIGAVEFEALVSAIGRLCLPGGQQLIFPAALGGRTTTVWADCRSIYVFLDGEFLRTRASQFTPADLRALVERGGRIAGPEPAASALPTAPLPSAVVEVDRLVGRDGDIGLAGARVKLAPHLAGQQVTLRFDGQLMHVIADGTVVKTMPAPVPVENRAQIGGARSPRATVIPPTAQALRAQRRVPADGVVMVAGQRLRIGRSHADKTVAIVIEDTVYRVLDGDTELSTHTRTSDKPIKQFRANARTHN